MQLIVLGLVACAAACSSSYPRIGRVVGYDHIPTEYGVAVNDYNTIIDKDRVNDDDRQQDTNDNHDDTEDANDVLDILLLSLE